MCHRIDMYRSQTNSRQDVDKEYVYRLIIQRAIVGKG